MNLEIISLRKKRLGLTTQMLSEKSKVPVGTINKILRGETKSPQINTLSAICSVLGCSVNDVISDEPAKLTNQPPEMLSDCFNFEDYSVRKKNPYNQPSAFSSKIRTLKLVDSGSHYTDEKCEILVNSAPEECDFAVRMCDGSMSPLYNEGEILFAKKSNFITSDTIGVFRIDGKIYVRKFENNMLTAVNPKYPPMYITEIKFEKLEGIVTGLME